jgi:hypothetical protein
VRIVGEATAQFPLEQFDVVLNGQVIATAARGTDRLTLSLDQDVRVERSGWIALRAKGQRGPTPQAGEAFAHTSAAYLDVAGHPVRSPQDAEYFITWIQRLREDVRQRNRIPISQQQPLRLQLTLPDL